MRAPSKRTAVAGVAVAALAAGSVALAVTHGGDSGNETTAAPRANAPASSSAPADPAQPPTMPSDQSSVSSKVGGKGAGNGGGTVGGLKARRPAPFGTSVRFDASGVSAQVLSVRSIHGTGHGIGEISGPALLVKLRLSDSGSRPYPMDDTTVNAYSGRRDVPASPLTGDSHYAPFAHTLRPGGSVVGTYVFAVPSRDPGAVRLEVSYAAVAPIAVFVGTL